MNDGEKIGSASKAASAKMSSPFLSDAITQADDKSRFLNNQERRVHDPTTDVVERKKLSVEVPRYIEAKSGCRKTVSAHEHAVTEFLAWAKFRRAWY